MYPLHIINGKAFAEVCFSEDIYEGKGKQIIFADDDDMQIAIFRIKNQLYCVDNICPHRHADRLFEGILDGLTVTCPLHGWNYSLETGENTNKHQGIKTLHTYEVFEQNGMIYVEKPPLRIPKWRNPDKAPAEE